MIKYKKISREEKDDLKSLINQVINELERKEFFIPFSEEKINNMLDENKIIAYGAYDNDKLIVTAQLYVDKIYIDDVKDILNLKSERLLKLGGYLILKEYRNRGIIKELESLLISKAKEMKYEYVFMIVHPENLPSIKAIENTGAKLAKTTNFGEYIRSIYLLEI